MATSKRRQRDYDGLLVIGDPHVEGRCPGFRSDDYPAVILEKLRWCLNHAITNNLLPVLLGDLFDKPRDNPTWLIGELIEMMLSIEVIGIYGNHDCADTTLNENDSLTILVKSGCLQIVSEEQPWIGEMNGRQVVVGGSSYRAQIPKKVPLPNPTSLFEEPPVVVWLTHHDISMVENDKFGKFTPFEIENVDLLINGHIHRRQDSVQCGKTRWMTPGNISRRLRVEAIRNHVPTILQIDVQFGGYRVNDVVVPHRPADEVFHELIVLEDAEEHSTRFVDGLKELQIRKTDSGAGLHQFLDLNLPKFDDEVAREIRLLAKQVTEKVTKSGEVIDV